MEGDPQASICFLCRNSVKVAETDLNGCHGNEKTDNLRLKQKFVTFTKNQFGLSLKDVLLDLDQLGNVFCGECNNVVCMICTLYDDLCSVQARLKEKVSQLVKLLEKSFDKKYNDCEEKTKVGRGLRNKGHYYKVVEKRIQLKQHCKRYCQEAKTRRSVHVPGDLSEDEVKDNHHDVQLDDNEEENVEVKSELDSLIGDEDGEEEPGNDWINLQNEMGTGTDAIENEDGSSSNVQNTESLGSPPAVEEDDNQKHVSAGNSDSDWKGESKSENEDETSSSNDSETDDEFKKEPLKSKIASNARSTKKETNANFNEDLGDFIYKCEKCNKPYISKGHLDRHLRTVHGLGKKRPATCDLCGKEFSQQSSLMRHKESKHNGIPKIEKAISHPCTKCDQSFQRKGCLDKHMIKVHKIGNIKPFIYNCNLCDKGFNIKGSFNRHQRVSHKIVQIKPQSPFFCETCRQFFKTRNSLRDHKKRAHEESLIGDENEEVDRGIECNISQSGTETEAIENKSDDASNVQNDESPDSPATEDDQKHWKGEPGTENDDIPSSNESKGNSDSSTDEFEDKSIDKIKKKKKTPKTKIAKIVRSTSNEVDLDFGETIYKCDKCSKPYVSEGYLNRHLRTVHGLGKSRYLTCDLCGKGFSQHSSLMRHKHSKHNGSPDQSKDVAAHTCTKCGQSFQRKGCLDKHMIKVHKIGSMKSFIYNCNLCGKGFNVKGSFSQHMRWSHRLAQTTKTQTQVFKTSSSIMDHKKRAEEENTIHGIGKKLVNLMHQSKNEVSCPKCSMKFDSRRQLIHHKYTVHKKDDITGSFMKRLESAKGNISDEVKENCVVCKEEFNSWEVLGSHLKTHEDKIPINEKNLMCFKCDELFAYEQTIWAHLRSSKKHDYTSVEFPCDHGDHLGYSQWVFQTPKLLKSHFKEEHNDCGVLKCEQCGCPFLDKNMLDIHRLLHIPRINKKYQCPVCPNTFLHQDSLQGHYNPVHGVSLKLFRCEVCTWGFATKRGLACHVKIHEEQQVCHEFLCSKCPKSFKTRVQLRDHSRQLHVTRQCPDCGILVQRSRYSRHRKMKHSQIAKGQLCTLCGMAFRDIAELKKHMAFHGEYHFKCQYCGKGCVSGWYLRKHIRKVHKEQVGNEGVK